MVAHIGMFWLKEKDDEALVAETVEKLNGMRGKIPGMTSLHAGRDRGMSPRGCHVCLSGLFTDWEALEAYQNHPVHLPVKAHMHAVMERSASADFEVEA
ncbi:MAG: Dabb family protein [Clostridia bacterium]|nr:Dabb family protein [Clostridia bacterium]